MNMVKKALCASLAFVLGTMAFAVQAQEKEEPTTKSRAVLFKIHDIKPVENAEDGTVTHCDFLVTFYNRTNDSLRQAKIDMGWTDAVSDRYFADTTNNEEKEESSRRGSRAADKNAEKALGSVTTTVEMPSLGSHKQATVKASVETEKCFLLLDELNFNVSVCNIIGKEDDANKNRGRRTRVSNDRNTSECANLFQYVDSSNPEYYDEFKNISYSQQEKILEEDKKEDTSELDAIYEGINKSILEAEGIMASIK